MAPHGTRADSPNDYIEKTAPYKGWMNDQGFEESYEQPIPTELTVTGNIPEYAAGVLYRTGPGGYKLQAENGTWLSASHWFDGFTRVHRFELRPSNGAMKVHYNSRSTTDEFLERMRKSGKWEGFSFGNKRDPCESFFKKVQTVFKSAMEGGYVESGKVDPSSVNVGVTLSVNMPGNPAGVASKNSHTGINTLYNKTDASVYQAIDPETLEPVGVCRQDSLHPELKGQLSAAHAKSDPETGDIYNYNLTLGAKTVYKIFRVSAATGKTDILATFTAPPAYIHSLFITADHVILCVWNAHISKNGASVLFNKNILDSIAPFDSSKPAKWFVVDRKHGKGLLATYESPAFFCFHSVNAWAEPSPSDPSKTDIVCDLSAYNNLNVLKKFYYENMMSTGSGAAAWIAEESKPGNAIYLRRYRLPDVPTSPVSRAKQASVDWEAPAESSVELPTFNGRYTTKKHRYTYGIVSRLRSTFVDGLVKYDAETHKPTYWERQSHTPGEPIFVANPDGTDEDDGVLLSVVLDGVSGKSYLLCLDARNMNELGKASVDGAIGFGFHGAHVPASTGKRIEV